MENTNTSGFYKTNEGELSYAPNFVYSPNCTLLRDNKAEYTYPMDGWFWFDNLSDAKAQLSVE